MKKENTFKEVEARVKSEGIMEKKYGKNRQIIDGDNQPVDAVFTTSQESDVREMISDGLSVDEIVSTIKRW